MFKTQGSISGIKTLILIVLFLSVHGCGYQLVGEKGIYGGEIKSVYVPVFKNMTYEPHASLYLTDAFTKQLMATGIFAVNKNNSDTYIEGVLKNIRIVPNALDKNGIVIEKNVLVGVEISLYKKDGNLLKKWFFSDNQIYRADDLSAEDYNKREAISSVSDRIARRFCASLMTEY
ncbi:MAG: LPS assembly lipoprotein LptE [Syntrophorhabdaceae bacterium]|nr:LPS assembly lipoprotein LptE [Syntrophorhabdaceae bacterium]